jgi:hypothetical protein
MPISGLLVTLVEDAATRMTALTTLRQHPAIDVGEPAGGRVPIVVETLDENEDRLVWEWLHAIPGVTFVVVAYIHFDEVAYIHFDEDASDVDPPPSPALHGSQSLSIPTSHEP